MLGRFAVAWLSRARCIQPVRYEDCPPLQPYQHVKQGTPTMGGLLLLAVGCVMAVGSGGLQHRAGWLVFLAVVALAAVGLVDDLLKLRGANALGLRSGPKLAVALAVGGLVGAGISSGAHDGRLVDVPWISRTLDLGGGWIPFAMLVVAGCAHAVNLADGMDGLAVGCTAIALATLGVFALTDPRHQVLVPWCASLAGACVGFLWLNGFPAAVFLGDVGALGLGAALGAVGLVSGLSLWLLIIGGVFVMEALSVILQVAFYKWWDQRRIFRVAPLHHHFQVGGMSEPKVIVRFWIAGLLLAVLSLTGLG